MKPVVTKSLDLGLQFAVAIGLCLYGGYWLDNKLHTMPLFVIIGILLGSSAGFLNIYREVYSKNRNKGGKTKE